jgi:hypothetical protein
LYDSVVYGIFGGDESGGDNGLVYLGAGRSVHTSLNVCLHGEMTHGRRISYASNEGSSDYCI